MADSDTRLKVLTFGGVARPWTPLIEETIENVEVVHCRNRKAMEDRYDGVKILFGWNFPESLFSRLPDLEWVQNLSVGIEKFVENPDLQPAVRVTNNH